MARAIVVGGANWDRTWRLPRLPRPGETVLGESAGEGPGGKALNVCVGLARLGGDVAIVAAVGADAEGDRLAAALAAEEVGLDGLVRMEDAPTGTAAIWLHEGESTIAVAPGAGGRLAGPAVAEALERCGDGCELLVLQAEAPDSALVAALDWCAARRAAAAPPPARVPLPRVLLSPAPARPLHPSLWEGADIVVCNRAEAAVHAGIAIGDPLDAEEAAIALCARGPSTAVVTLGADGAVVARRGRRGATYVPPVRVDVVDPTGAGDCAVGAFARAALEGFDIFASTGYAMAAAAICVGRPGAAAAMPTADEVDRIVHSVDLRRDEGNAPARLPP